MRIEETTGADQPYVGGLRKFKSTHDCLKSEELTRLVSMQKCVACPLLG
jgi:hypothetical protein